LLGFARRCVHARGRGGLCWSDGASAEESPRSKAMSLLPAFDHSANDERPPQAARLGPRLKALAERGVSFGTSSWKYEGWLGSIYSPQRYATRGKFSKKKFEESCLAEYALTFPTVCGDFAFYQFPTDDYWRRLFEGTPSSFTIGLKVPETITV